MGARERKLWQCMKCRHRWTDYPGGWAENYSGCPNCGNLYWEEVTDRKGE